MKTYFKAVEKIWKVLFYVEAFLFFAMLCVVFWQVICRFVIKSSSGWTSEITTLLFVYVIYLGAALAIHTGGQIAMTILLNKLKGVGRSVLKIITALINELMYVLLAISGIQCMMKFHATKSPGLAISMTWSYAALGICGVLMIIMGFEDLFKPILEIANRRKGEISE